MTFRLEYKNRLEALSFILPFLEETPDFALKGGTAINLFYQELPRLSVDIDLCYLPICDRKQTISEIDKNLKLLKKIIEDRLKWKVVQTYTKAESLSKLIVHSPLGDVKIEPNYTLRGSVWDTSTLELSNKSREILGAEASVKCLSFEDTYAGKFCAALDRQHPRDLFDLHILFKESKITPQIVKTFIVYLLQSNRPFHEILSPNCIEIGSVYESEFKGMANEEVSLSVLENIQRHFPGLLMGQFSEQDKKFLMQVSDGTLNWNLLGIGDYSHLTGIAWRMRNIGLMDEGKKSVLNEALGRVLFP